MINPINLMEEMIKKINEYKARIVNLEEGPKLEEYVKIKGEIFILCKELESYCKPDVKSDAHIKFLKFTDKFEYEEK